MFISYPNDAEHEHFNSQTSEMVLEVTKDYYNNKLEWYDYGVKYPPQRYISINYISKTDLTEHMSHDTTVRLLPSYND